MLKKVYLLVLRGKSFEKRSIEFSEPPTEQDIINALQETVDALSARVEEHYKFIS